jgi:site-specific recombinase XerD
MFREWKLAQNTVSQCLGALRFFYTQVLKQTWSTAETPYPKKVLHLPQGLSQEEVARLIEAAQTRAPRFCSCAKAASPRSAPPPKFLPPSGSG